MLSEKSSKKHKNAQNNNVVIIGSGRDGDTADQGIRFVFAQNPNGVRLDIPPVLATTVPFQTNVGDRVKLDAMVQIEVETSGGGGFAFHVTDLSIIRITKLLGQDSETEETVVTVKVRDNGLNNDQIIVYDRVAAITWVDTPPAGIIRYTLRVTDAANGNIEQVTYFNRALNATIFPIGSSLS